MIRSVCVCVCPLPALLKIELGCTDCHTHADMLSLKLYLPVSETVRFPHMSRTSPPRTSTQGSHSQEGTAVVVRDLPEHPRELGDTERNGVRNTRVGKLISRRCSRSSRKGKLSLWRHARGTNTRPPSRPARSWSYPSA